jgi:hypothetical protein
MTLKPETSIKNKLDRFLYASLGMIIVGTVLFIWGMVSENNALASWSQARINSIQYFDLAGFILITLGPLITIIGFKWLVRIASSTAISPGTRTLAAISFGFGSLISTMAILVGIRKAEDGWWLLLVPAAALAIHAGMIRGTLLALKSVKNTPPSGLPGRKRGPGTSENRTGNTAMPMTTCPNCKMRVLPKADGTCPSCQYQLG